MGLRKNVYELDWENSYWWTTDELGKSKSQREREEWYWEWIWESEDGKDSHNDRVYYLDR